MRGSSPLTKASILIASLNDRMLAAAHARPFQGFHSRHGWISRRGQSPGLCDTAGFYDLKGCGRMLPHVGPLPPDNRAIARRGLAAWVEHGSSRYLRGILPSACHPGATAPGILRKRLPYLFTHFKDNMTWKGPVGTASPAVVGPGAKFREANRCAPDGCVCSGRLHQAHCNGRPR